MKLGFVTAILPELRLNEVLEFAAGEGFSCVEVMCWPVGKAERKFAGVTHIDVASFTSTQANDVNALLAKHKVGISGLGYYPNPLDPNPEAAKTQVDHLKKVMLAADKLGIRNVNTFIGRDWTRSVDDNWPRFLKTWKPLIGLAEDHDIRVGIENCPMLFTNDEWPGGKNLATTPVIWRRMFADIPSRHFGLNYDPSHFVWQHMDWLKPIPEFADRLFHIHAKDVRILREGLNENGILATPLKFHQPRVPGFGEIDWGRFIGTLKANSYAGPVCIEVEDDTFGKSLEGRQLALKTARNVLAPFIPK